MPDAQLIKRHNAGGPERLGDQRVNNGTEPTIVTSGAPESPAALKERIKTLPADGGQWTVLEVALWPARFHNVQSVHDQRG